MDWPDVGGNPPGIQLGNIQQRLQQHVGGFDGPVQPFQYLALFFGEIPRQRGREQPGRMKWLQQIVACCRQKPRFLLIGHGQRMIGAAQFGGALFNPVLQFHARALKVLSWQGYNMLGNRDGEILKQEGHKAAKLTNKDEALRSILEQDVPAGERDLHSHVAIDFVPSLGDWKTAWDFVHFEGFLGTRMSLQFTWAGSDSALAAPLVLDLARLTELAMRRGEVGVLPQTACFFKAPMSGGTHDFHVQYRELLDYVGRVAKA